jgi:hypothetical protein
MVAVAGLDMLIFHVAQSNDCSGCGKGLCPAPSGRV